ncbi:hypothetical protein O181_069818 [Austropuccinia psidii MF-1]|uniref:Integrase catalytic domain-containing protein n=1 Tax=Austropuccinia psidii MF-1 TaxID=1389203 RepID=A0A9Q3EXX2_9BASI|nr:hypothetical protein [Austropuccinia psidii MF-1]
MFFPCHKNDTAMETDLTIWNGYITHTGLFQKIISNRATKLTSALWTNLHKFLAKKLSFSTAYHSQTDDSNGFTHDWCTLIPAIELAYKTPIHSSTSKAPEMLEKGRNARLPYDTLKKYLVDTHPTANSLKSMLEKARNHANICMEDSFKYAKKDGTK